MRRHRNVKIVATLGPASSTKDMIRALPFVQREVEAGTYLVREATTPQRCAFVLSGYAFRQKLTSDGARQIMAVMLPGADPDRLARVVAAEPDFPPAAPRWPVRLAALGGAEAAERLRLSRHESRAQEELRFAGSLGEAAWRFGQARAGELALLRAADGALPAGWRDRIAAAEGQRLPVTAADLAGRLTGAALGRGLKAAEAAWIESGFALPAPALIDIALLAGEAP